MNTNRANQINKIASRLQKLRPLNRRQIKKRDQTYVWHSNAIAKVEAE